MNAMEQARRAMLSTDGAVVIPPPVRLVADDLLADALNHIVWAREDLAKGEYLRAMMNVIGGNRCHAMAPHGTANWDEVGYKLRAVQRELWKAVGR